MRTSRFSQILLLGLLTLSSIFSVAQSTPTTGIPPLSSTAGGPFDTLNLANLNAHFAIPVFSRPGKGISFSYTLNYDTLVWQVATNSQGQLQWAPMANWGWHASTEPATGYVTYTYSATVVVCSRNNVEKETWSNFVYHDPMGVPHRFGGTVWIYDDNGCGSSHPSMAVTSIDGSGYQIQLGPVVTGEYDVPTTVTGAGGTKISPPSLSSSGSGTIQDANGNLITASSSGTTTFTDTLGTTALTVTGTAPSAMNYTYTAPTGQAHVTVTYRSYTVTTSFGISGITEYSATGIGLVDRVTLPDGSYYQFYYEMTGTGQPYTGGGVGPVTGRIAKVTLPTGGTIAYAYGSTGGHNSMMADGSPSYMTHTVAGGIWTYTRGYQTGSSSPQQTVTTVFDPDSNETDLQFSGIYETSRYQYSGNRASNALLEHTTTTYNGCRGAGCETAVVNPPITERTVFDHLADPSYNYFLAHDYYFNSYGLIVTANDLDYQAISGNGVARSVVTAYSSSLCTSFNICDRPISVQTLDNSSASKSYTAYGYDEAGSPTHGSVTTIKQSISGTPSGPFLTRTFAYNAGGTLASSVSPNGTTTTYGYAGGICNNAFPTSVSVSGTSVALTTSYTYSCIGGVVLTVQDPNGAITTATYSDPFFWRPASTKDPLNNTTNYSYYPTLPRVGQVESIESVGVGSAVVDILVTPDTFGRPWLKQQRQSSSGNYDTTQLMYDENSRVSWAIRPYTSSAGQGVSCCMPATGYTYDALGRTTDITDWTGVHTDYVYSVNDVKVTVSPAPNGENTKSRQLQYDVLGRLTSVCEITSAAGSGACSQSSAATGFLSTYAYDALGNLTNVTQGGQTRSFTFDGLGRMLTETHPETSSTGTGGKTTYVYDSACGQSSSGDLAQRTDPAGNVSCYGYDGLHRLTSITYPSGPNAANMPRKDFWYDIASWYGIAISNPKGHLVGARTWDNTLQVPLTLEAFSYDLRGQATDYYQVSTNSGGWYHIQQSYAVNGNRATLQGFLMNNGAAFTHNFSYDLGEGEGRPQGLMDNTAQASMWCCTAYNPAGQPNQVLMVGGWDFFGYDSNSGRMTQWMSENSAATKTQTGTLTWNPNGTLQNLAMTDGFNSSDDNMNCTYGYDDLARLSSTNCGSKWGQNFSYDTFGNITKSGNVIFNKGYGSGNHVTGFNYDGMGNVTNDGSNTYSYDAEGRPVSVGSTQILYDAFNRTVELNNGSSHSQVVYDPQGAKLAYMSGQTLQKYMLPLAGGVQAVFNSSGLWYYRHSDWLGSSRLALDVNGNLYAGRAYAPFGEPYAETGAADRSFTGQTQDVIAGPTGIYDFLFRQHASSQGRWLVPDPAGLAAVDITNPQTWNRYAYVGNNPLSNVDPLGLCGGDWTNMWNESSSDGSVAQTMVQGDSPCPFQSFWSFVIQGLPQRVYCAVTGACVPNPPFGGTAGGGRGGGGGGSSQPQPTAPSAPKNGNVAKTVTQNCLSQYNSSTAGKVVQFFSLYNLATNFKNAWPDWTVLPALKFLSVKAVDTTSQAIGNTEFLSVTGGASTEILSPTAALIQGGEKLAGRLAGPGLALATGLDVLANAGCGTMGFQAAGQMTPLPPGIEVTF